MKYAIAALLSVLMLSLQACSTGTSSTTSYSAEPIIAWIVDAETKQPLAGVSVVAHWQLEGGPEGGNNIGQMMVMEAVTDSAGKFSFPAWGPKEMPTKLQAVHSNARLKDKDPRLLLFKSAYGFLAPTNPSSHALHGSKEPYVRTSQWNGKTIEMKRFHGSLEQYYQHLLPLYIDLEEATATVYFANLSTKAGVPSSEPRGGCGWKEIPEMISAVAKQTEIFRDSHVVMNSRPFDEYLLGVEEAYRRRGCGSVEAFFREHVK